MTSLGTSAWEAVVWSVTEDIHVHVLRDAPKEQYAVKVLCKTFKVVL